MNPAASRSAFSLWLWAVRPFAYSTSITPVCLAAALAVYLGVSAQWLLLAPALLASVSIHTATNLVSDYFDFLKGLDTDESFGSERILVKGFMKPRQILLGGLFCFALTAAVGLVFVWIRGWPILVIGLIGMAGGFFYSCDPIGYKYRGLGDPLVFCLMGPLMVVGSFFVLTGSYVHSALLVSLPIGCLVAAILSANNLRDIAHDSRLGIKTTAGLLGHRRARQEYAALVLSAYGFVAALLLMRMLPLWSLLTFLTAPLAIANVRSALASAPEKPQAIAALDLRTAALHLTFGLLLIVSLLLGAFV